MKLNLRAKLLGAIVGTITVIYALSVGYMGYNLHNKAVTQAKELADVNAEKYAAFTKANLDVDMDIARTMAQGFSDFAGFTDEERTKAYNSLMVEVLKRNAKFSSVWSSWELSALDSNYTKDYGRTRFAFFRNNTEIGLQHDTVDLDGDKVGGTYYKIKIAGKETVVNPYYYTYTDGNSFFKLLETTVAVPIIVKDQFVGLVGIDLGLERFQEMIDQIHPWESSYAFLISNNGSFISHSDKELINKPFAEVYPELDKEYRISSKIENGEKFSYNSQQNGNDFYVSVAPVFIGKSVTPWAIAIAVPLDIILADARKYLIITIFGGIIGLFVLVFVVVFLSNYITKPINKISKILQQISTGNIDSQDKMSVETSDEIGEIRQSVNGLIDSLLETVDFARNIGEGKLESEFRYVGERDILGAALLNMRQSLVRAKEEEVSRKIDEERINWSTIGHNKLSDILRLFSFNIEELSYEIVSFLIKYLHANQGGLFIIRTDEDEKTYVEMTGHYAYDKRRISNRKFEIGEGLIGRCLLEKETVFLTEIPDDYLNVTSGLGYQTPKYLVIIPLMFNKEVYGAMEIASFLPLEDYKIKFLEESGASIASGISIVVLNTQRGKLFEETQIKSQELASQEEEMRQNFEEMMSTQEEMSLREKEYKNLLTAIKTVTYVAEYSMDGRMTDINDQTLELLNLSRSQIIGRYQGTFEARKGDADAEFNEFWRKLRAGETLKKLQHIRLRGKDFYLSEVYTPILNEAGIPYKVLNIAVDVTDSYHAGNPNVQ